MNESPSRFSRVIEEMDLSEPARALLAGELTPMDAVARLADAGLVQDALKLIARLLPKRYSVAWLCQLARAEVDLGPEERAGLSLAERWLRDPSEANRRAAFDFANSGGYKSCGAWIAAAAGWSSGSLAPAMQETAVPPADHLTARAVVAALNLLAAKVEVEFVSRRAAYIQPALPLLVDTAA